MDIAVVPSLALVLVLVLGGPMIKWLSKRGAGQRVRNDGPQRHLEKEGTPTMGGVLIVAAATIAALVGVWRWRMALPRILVTEGAIMAFAVIGFADDWLKLKRGRSLGLRARHKLGLQFAVAAGFVVALGLSGWEQWGLSKPVVLSNHVLRMLFWTIAVVATSNAMNLADGLDGLAAGLCVLAAAGFMVLGLVTGPREVALLAIALASACLGYLQFNLHPARLFMGDVGSLALGAGLAGMAAMLNSPLALIGLCAVPFVEEASVIAQVISFRATRKRILKMSPIHHHFELSGWSEQKVVGTFWAVGAVMAAVTVAVGIR
jgi:phospho-N-acetylmuramoyl-pentapeptide-transferase